MDGCRSWIDSLPAAVKTAVESRMRIRVVADAQSIYTGGDAAVECYRVRSGAVRIIEYTLLGREFQLALCRPGDCFGEIGLIDDLVHSDNAYAVGRTELDVLDDTSFELLRDEHPEIDRSIGIHLCTDIRKLTRQLLEANLLPLKERLPRLLAELIERGARAGIADVSQNDLANMLGVTRQSVSNELRALQRQGWIELGYRSVSIRDLAGFLERFGGSFEHETPRRTERAQ